MYDWWHGTGFNNVQYRRQLMGHKPLQKSASRIKQEIIIPENTTPGLMRLNVPARVRQIKTPAYTLNTKAKGVATPQLINPFTKSNNQQYIDIQPSGLVYQPVYKDGGKIIKAQSGGRVRPGGLPGEGYKVNLPNLDDTIRAGIAARAIYHDRDLQRKSLSELYKRQFQTPQVDRAKYNFSDIEQGYNEAKKPYLESRFVTSDPRDSMAFKLSKAQQLSSLAAQKNSQITQRKTQLDDMNRQIDAANEQARVQTANEKSQYLTNLNYQNRMLDSVTWNRLFSDVINPFGQQMSQQGRDAFNKNAQLQYQLDVQAAQREENARVNGELQRQYGTKWAGLSNADKQRYGSLEEYAYTIDPEGYKTIVKNNSIYNDLMTSAMRKYTNMTGAGLFYKSGGTINIRNTNKNLRSAQEQIAINSAKSAKRSVDELSKALFKMLAELTK